MSAWILIGYLAWNTKDGGGGPFTAEFATEAACRAAAQQVLEYPLTNYAHRRAICVPKG